MLIQQLLQPTADELAQFLNTHLQARTALVQVASLAEVTYRGRAASTAEVGTYLVLLKRDGSLQIHHPTGIKPMNWQPKTDTLTARVDEEACTLIATRRSPVEVVQVLFLQPEIAQAIDLSTPGEFLLTGSEAQMQELLAQQPDIIEQGLHVLNRELLVDSGGIDLYARDIQGRYVVVELKRGRATQNAVSQLARYVRSVEADMPPGTAVRGILAAPSITTPARKELESRGLEFKEVQALPTVQMESGPSNQPFLFD